MHIIHRVSVDTQDRIDTVEWQTVDPGKNAWVGERMVVPTLEVVDEIMKGGKVAMWVEHGPGNGPWITTYADDRGHEWIKVNDMNGETRTLHQLPRLPSAAEYVA
jgi:hypothetical protein